MVKPVAYSYIRFSTPEQRKGDGLRRQMEASKKWAEEHGYALDNKLKLRDEGRSAFHGDHLERGYLGQFLEHVEAGRIPSGSALIVENLDRLSREKISKAQALFLQIIQAGITVVTTMDNKVYTVESIDDNPMDLMMSILFMMRAHEESKTKSIRGTKAWEKKREAAANGGLKLTGRTKGWLELSKDRKSFKVIAGRGEIVNRIFLERLKGKSPPRIAREFNQDLTLTWKPVSVRHKKECGWWPGYVERILKDRAVIGEGQPCKWIGKKHVPGGPPIENYYPAIVAEDIYYQVQATFQNNTQPTKDGNGVVGMGCRGSVHNLFSFIARCGHCGDGMQHYKGNLVCSRAKRKAGCERHFVPYQLIENVVLRFCRGLQPADLLPDREEAESRLRTLQRQLSATETRLALLTGRENTLLDEIQDTPEREQRRLLRPRLKAIQDGKAALAIELSRIEQEIKTATGAETNIQEHLEGLRQLYETMEGLEGQERIELRLRLRTEIRKLIDHIEIYPQGSAQVPGVTIPSPEDMELWIHFHSGRYIYLSPYQGIGLEYKGDGPGEY